VHLPIPWAKTLTRAPILSKCHRQVTSIDLRNPVSKQASDPSQCHRQATGCVDLRNSTAKQGQTIQQATARRSGPEPQLRRCTQFRDPLVKFGRRYTNRRRCLVAPQSKAGQRHIARGKRRTEQHHTALCGSFSIRHRRARTTSEVIEDKLRAASRSSHCRTSAGMRIKSLGVTDSYIFEPFASRYSASSSVKYGPPRPQNILRVSQGYGRTMM
jgi:hypothetical protein